MNELGLTFHHLGVAVNRPEDAIRFLSVLGYALGEPVLDPLQNVRLIMCTHIGEPAVEIISPGTEGSKSPVDFMVAKHASGIIYHSCYMTRSLAKTLAQAEDLGLRFFCVSSPKPAVLFGGRKVSFYNVVGMGLIEIIEPLEEGAPFGAVPEG